MSAGVREIVIDGTRALAFSTGGGLDFTVLVDRSLDIGPLSWRGRSVGWLGPAGFRHPAGHDPYADDGRGFERLFSGFLVTGGLEHIRQPANGRPLHGTLPFTPATLTASGVDEQRGLLFCDGEVRQPGFRLRRRIETAVGGHSFTILDEVENIAPAAQHQASLYHFNIGRPALTDGTTVHQGPQRRLGPLAVPSAALGSASWPVSDGGAACRVTMPDLVVDFSWDGATLPHLQLWGDLSPARGVLSVEPATSARVEGGLSGEEPLLLPGEVRQYSLSITLRSGHIPFPSP